MDRRTLIYAIAGGVPAPLLGARDPPLPTTTSGPPPRDEAALK